MLIKRKEFIQIGSLSAAGLMFCAFKHKLQTRQELAKMIMQLLGNVPALPFLYIDQAFGQFSLSLPPCPHLLKQFCIFDGAGSLVRQPS